MGWFSKALLPRSARQTARTIALGALGLVAGTWLIALLTQLKLFDNPQGQLGAVKTFFEALTTETWFLLLTGGAVGLAAGVFVDSLLARRAARRWWDKLFAFSIRDGASLLAGIDPIRFEGNQRALGIANELKGYVDSGFVPLFLELSPNQNALSPLKAHGPQYDKKQVDYGAVIPKGQIEDLARARGWPLPWPVPQKVDAAPVVPRLTGTLGEYLARMENEGK